VLTKEAEMATVSLKEKKKEPLTLYIKVIEPPANKKEVLKEVAETNLLIKQLKEELQKFLGG